MKFRAILIHSMLLLPLAAEDLMLEQVHTIGSVEIQRDKKQIVRTLICEGPTVLTVKDRQKGLAHKLSSWGTLNVHHSEQKVLIESPRDSDGQVSNGKQVHFEDALGEIFADRVFFFYCFEEGRMNPIRLELEGDVRIYNRSSASIQYALADRAEFQFESNILFMSAIERKNVLFYDTYNKVQASAPSLQVKRDPETGSESIKGNGDVRFLFAEEEWQELKKRFSLHETS